MSALARKVPLSGDRDIDGVLWGVKWNVSTLTFAFPSAASDYSDYPPGAISGFEKFNHEQVSAVREILKDVAGISKLAFDFTTDAGSANLRFGEAKSIHIGNFVGNGPINTAIGLPPDLTEVPRAAIGDSFYNPELYNSPVIGSYDYVTLLHEIGHLLGLKHGHSAMVSPDGSFTFPRLSSNRDSMEYSVMTYRSYVGDSITNGYNNEKFGFAQSLMMNDIAALQYLYGADYTHNAGNTVYRWSESTGEMFIDGKGQGTPGANRIFLTIWDGGGTDTYDLSNYGLQEMLIDLRAGKYSTISSEQRVQLNADTSLKARGNIYNALLHDGDLHSLIENAIGSDGRNFMIGNQVSNRLTGRGGNDVIFGQHGNDSLRGDSGQDRLEGGSGNDLLLGGIKHDDLAGGTGYDRLLGGSGSDHLYGNSGNDLLRGGDGADYFYGGAGDDRLISIGTGGFDNDYLNGGAGNDVFVLSGIEKDADYIADFSSHSRGNDDTIELDHHILQALTPGKLGDNQMQFVNPIDGIAALTPDIRIIYDYKHGNLYYDPDGSGPLKARYFAKVTGDYKLNAADILIV